MKRIRRQELNSWLAGIVALTALALAAPMFADMPTSQPALAYAPKGATMIAHFDGPALVKAFGMAREAAKDRKLVEEDSAGAKSFEALGELLKKIQSVDAYVVSADKANFPMLALHTKCEINDLYDLIKKTDEHLPELTRLDKGKYVIKNPDKKNVDQEIFTLLDGDAIEKVGAGTILVAMAPSKLTMEAVNTIGTGPSDKLAKLVKDLDEFADGWLAADFSGGKDRDLPQTLQGALYLREFEVRGPEASFLRATFSDKFGAMFFMRGLEPLKDACNFVQVGTSVTVSSKVSKELWDSVITVYLRRQSIENLHKVEMAIQAYMAQHRNRLPASLNELVKDKLLTAQQLVSPTSGRTLKADKDGMPLGDGDYVYISYGQLDDDANWSLIPLVYEPLELNKGQGSTVVFADLHVQWMDREAFVEIMKESDKEAHPKKGK